jgi:hypothetical protein
MQSPGILFVQLGLRIVGAMVCSSKARSLNRNSGAWGLFGFMMPIIAMIWVQFMKPIVDWNKGPDENDTYN